MLSQKWGPHTWPAPGTRRSGSGSAADPTVPCSLWGTNGGDTDGDRGFGGPMHHVLCSSSGLPQAGCCPCPCGSPGGRPLCCWPQAPVSHQPQCFMPLAWQWGQTQAFVPWRRWQVWGSGTPQEHHRAPRCHQERTSPAEPWRTGAGASPSQ